MVDDNDLIGVREAVHVGLSAGGLGVRGSDRQVDMVQIRGNRAVMRVPLGLQLGPRGYFVGNGRHIRIAENEMAVDSAGAEPVFREGIRVWGQLKAAGSASTTTSSRGARSASGLRRCRCTGLPRWSVSRRRPQRRIGRRRAGLGGQG